MTDTIKISRELLERAATLLQDSLHPPAGCDSFDDWTAQGNALAAELRALLAAQPQASYKVPCKTHPDAPHGFCRNSSHSEGRYVCECEHWEEPQASAAQSAPAGEREAEAAAIAEEIDWLIRQWDAKVSWSGERMAELLEAAGKAAEMLTAWQRTQSAGVPDAWRDALQKIARHAPPVNCAAKTEVEKLALIAVHALIAFSAPQFSKPTDHQSAKVGTAAPAQPAAPAQSEVQRLREALPYLRNAVAEASASGVAQLAVVSTKPDGSGKLVCKFECVEFMADLAAVVGAGPQTEDDDARAEARKFLQRNGIASTGQEVKP